MSVAKSMSVLLHVTHFSVGGVLCHRRIATEIVLASPWNMKRLYKFVNALYLLQGFYLGLLTMHHRSVSARYYTEDSFYISID